MYVYRDLEKLSCSHCCCGKAVSITYSACVLVVLGIQQYYIFCVRLCGLRYQACNTHVPYCYLWPAPFYHIFPHYLVNGTIYVNKRCWTQNVCFDFLYNFVWNISHSKKNSAGCDHKCTYIGLHAQYLSGVPRNFFRGGSSTNLVQDRGSCHLVHEISFHIVKFS